MRRAGDRVRINAQLVDAEGDRHVWAERFDRTIDDIFDIQDQITKVLDAQMIYNAKDIGGRSSFPSLFLQPRSADLAPPERP